ncbi:MAG: NAD-dependent epimerase/dehydratase family protein, partial [Chloroflexia bacterium]|nr:NAD-dependent epimerase/dehydratase family protein [Chloroflexia bacterium]
TTGTAYLLEAARQGGCQRVVLASTCAVYGDRPGVKDEADPLHPQSPYSASKLMAENLMRCYASGYGMQTVSLRYFNVYGPRQRADSPYSGVLARWCAAAQTGEGCRVFGNGEQTRDFISVHDVARANSLALTTASVESGTSYNIATGQSTSLNTILATIHKLIGPQFTWEHAAARPGDILHSEGDSKRFQRVGWQPRIDLLHGLSELLGQGNAA